MDLLPDEALCHILSFLEPPELCGVTSVSRQWAECAADQRVREASLARMWKKSLPYPSTTPHPYSATLLHERGTLGLARILNSIVLPPNNAPIRLLSHPTCLAQADGQLLIGTQSGQIYAWQPGHPLKSVLTTPLAELSPCLRIIPCSHSDFLSCHRYSLLHTTTAGTETLWTGGFPIKQFSLSAQACSVLDVAGAVEVWNLQPHPKKLPISRCHRGATATAWVDSEALTCLVTVRRGKVTFSTFDGTIRTASPIYVNAFSHLEQVPHQPSVIASSERKIYKIDLLTQSVGWSANIGGSPNALYTFASSGGSYVLCSYPDGYTLLNACAGRVVDGCHLPGLLHTRVQKAGGIPYLLGWTKERLILFGSCDEM